MARKPKTTVPVKDPEGAAGAIPQITQLDPPAGVTNGHAPANARAFAAPRPDALPTLATLSVHEIITGVGNNPRTLFDKNGDKDGQLTGLAELAESIREQGLLQPIIVRPATALEVMTVWGKAPTGYPGPQGSERREKVSEPGKFHDVEWYRQEYILVAGERRLRAVRDILKQDTITALVRHDLDPALGLEATVLENLQRRDLDPMEEARGLAMLRAKYGYSVETLAKRLGRRPEWVKGRLQLADLPAAAQDILLHSKRIPLATAWALHELTAGGSDNKGFPDAITAVLRAMDKDDARYFGERDKIGALLDLVAEEHTEVTPDSVAVAVRNWNYQAHFPFATECKTCPFGAFKPGRYNNESGYCLHLEHWRKLYGEAKQKESEAKKAQAAQTGGAAFKSPISSTPQQTPAQKGKETRARRKAQQAQYPADAEAARRAGTLVAGMDWPEVAVLLAYTLAGKAVDREWQDDAGKRHGVKLPIVNTGRPSAADIEAVRKLDPVRAMRATIEAILLTQAQRKKVYEPEKWNAETPHEGVWSTYITPGAVKEADHALHTPFGAENRFAADSAQGKALAAIKEDARAQGHDPHLLQVDKAAWERLGIAPSTLAVRCLNCEQEAMINFDGSYSPDTKLLTTLCAKPPVVPDLPPAPEGDLDDSDRFVCDGCGEEYSLADMAYQDAERTLCADCHGLEADEEDPDGVQAAAIAELDGEPMATADEALSDPLGISDISVGLPNLLAEALPTKGHPYTGPGVRPDGLVPVDVISVSGSTLMARFPDGHELRIYPFRLRRLYTLGAELAPTRNALFDPEGDAPAGHSVGMDVALASVGHYATVDDAPTPAAKEITRARLGLDDTVDVDDLVEE